MNNKVNIVGGVGIPPKVIHAVIRVVAVVMAGDRTIWAWADERFQNQGVYTLPVATPKAIEQRHPVVVPRAAIGLHHPASQPPLDTIASRGISI